MRSKKIIFGLLSMVLLLSGVKVRSAAAQDGVIQWQQPINLSRSGSATNPAVVVDSNGNIHAVWNDEFKGWIYTSSIDGSEWSEPVATNMPFDEGLPELIASPDGFIHAFWIISEGDDRTLYYDRTGIDSIGAGGWAGSETLAENAFDFDVSITEDGEIHLAYLRSLDDGNFPAGIYYRKSSDGGNTWSSPGLIFQSAYYRSLLPDQANVNVATTSSPDNSLVYIVWDNPARKQVLLSKSIDGGETWLDILEVDRPTEETGLTDPYHIQVEASGEDVLLLWQAGLQSGFACTQYFQWSQNRGENWSERQSILHDLVGCPQGTKFFPGEDGIDFMFTVVQDRYYMLAWNWEKHVWSDTYLQGELAALTNPDTLEAVALSCRQTYADGSDRLFLVGCDTVGPRDIWITSRPFGEKSDWFIDEPTWSAPVNISASPTGIASPIVISDEEGMAHVLWSQPDDGNASIVKNSIYYSQNRGSTWPEGVRTVSSPGGSADQPAAALDGSGRLHLVWSGDQSGQIYYSWASSRLANHPREWAEPLALPSPAVIGSSPDIAIGEDGVIYIVFAVPINEARGIYLTRSTDGGRSWTEPVKVFDAAQAQWDMVDKPVISYGGDGKLHLLVSRYAPPGRGDSIGLYYLNSSDGGQNWSQPSAVIEKSTVWDEIIRNPGQGLHRFWMEVDGGVPSLWQQISTDDGLSWGVPANLTRVGEITGPVAVAVDNTGRLLLLQVIQEQDRGVVIKTSTWAGGQWTPMENLPISGAEAVGDIDSLAAGISGQGDLFVAFSKRVQGGVVSLEEEEGLAPQTILSVASRSLQINGEPSESSAPIIPTQAVENLPATVLGTQDSQAQADEEVVATPSPTPDRKLTLNVGGLSSDNGLGGGSYTGLIIGVAGSILITVVIFTLKIRTLLRR